MTLSNVSKVFFSFHDGWDELVKTPPSINRLIALVVLPFSLMPPAMIYYAGSQYGDVFLSGASREQWHRAAGIFFVAELLTVPFIALLIRAVAGANHVAADFRDCFRLAALAPIPLWISSAVLLVPNLIVCLLVGTLALLGSLALTFRGSYALFRMHDDLRAMQMATVVTGAGFLAWLVLMQILLVH